jgi:hypothetical protein
VVSASFLIGVAVGIVIGLAASVLAIAAAVLAAGRLFMNWVVHALP